MSKVDINNEKNDSKKFNFSQKKIITGNVGKGEIPTNTIIKIPLINIKI